MSADAEGIGAEIHAHHILLKKKKKERNVLVLSIDGFPCTDQ